MRTFPWFLSSFLLVILFGLLTGCGIPPSKPIENPLFPESTYRRASRDADEWKKLEEWREAKKRDSGNWWRCTRDQSGDC